jgi:polysaccharide export outer membrane protein
MKTKLLLAAFLLVSPALFAQSDFTIGVADELDINVLGVADFSRQARVSGAGTISLPFLGDVEVKGLTCRQVEAKLAKLLNPEYVKDPQVSVSVKDSRSRMFSLMGAIAKPGQYQLTEPVTLVSAIANAGGLDQGKAGDKATIQRSYQAPKGQTVQIEIDLKKLLSQGDMSLDVPLMPGDFINIPQRDMIAQAVYIIGDVSRPGSFDFPLEKGIKLSRAMAIAGGPTKTAKLKGTTLIREKKDGSIDRISLDLGKVLKGQMPDIELQPNDLVYVPSSVTKNLGWSTMATIPSSILSRLILY